MSEILNPEMYSAILENLPAAVYVVDCERRILLWNSGAESLTGFLRQEVIGRSCRDDLLMHCDEDHACLCGVACPLQQTMYDGKVRTTDVYLLHKNGQRVPVRVSAVPLRNEHGHIVGAVECFEKRQMFPTADPLFRKLSQESTHDGLTGLPDHSAMVARLRAYLDDFAVSAVPFGVLSIAVDGLDLVRHTDGRSAVDKILSATGQTLANMLGPNDGIGRWSEERFVAVLAACTAPALLRAGNMMKRLGNLEGVPWWGTRLRITLSMGGAIVQADDTMESLLSRANAALESGLLQPGDSIAVA